MGLNEHKYHVILVPFSLLEVDKKTKCEGYNA